jgi:hypothetical protein
MTALQFMVVGAVFFGMQLLMVNFMAMLIQNIATDRDHDPGEESAYALAAIAPVPLWLSSLALFVPSLGFAIAAVLLAWFASAALIRHGVRPLLHIDDRKMAHRIANLSILCGIAGWIGLLVVGSMILSLLLGNG